MGGRAVQNLNPTFRTVVAAMKHVPVLSHTQRVTRLYRTALRLLDSWVIDRDLWNEEASKVRAQFEANRHHGVDSGYGRAACVPSLCSTSSLHCCALSSVVTGCGRRTAYAALCVVTCSGRDVDPVVCHVTRPATTLWTDCRCRACRCCCV